jgi:glycosyltransferase involved in cell wall biosynthesis
MNSNPKISVVVPVYNVKGYVEECVMSILTQSYRNLEVILVDDGSTDGSDKVCDALSEIDGRVKVFHKANGGSGDARNFGLSHSCGEWVSFVDSDDYLSPVFIEALFKAAVQMDCLVSAVPFGKQFTDGENCELVESLESLPVAVKIREESVQRLMLYQRLDTGTPWRLYRREVLGNDPFPKNLYYEDLDAAYKILHGVGWVSLIDCKDLYAYRTRQDSIIHQTYNHLKCDSAIKVSSELSRQIPYWYPELSTAVKSRIFSLCRMVFAQLVSVKGASVDFHEDEMTLWTILSSTCGSIIMDKNARKRERVAALIARLGKTPFQAFCLLMRRIGLLR